MNWKPCPKYCKNRIKRLIGSGKTPIKICNLDIPYENKFWIFFKSGIISENDYLIMWGEAKEKAVEAWKKAKFSEASSTWNLAWSEYWKRQLEQIKEVLVRLEGQG